jgi:hypothetical protein
MTNTKKKLLIIYMTVLLINRRYTYVKNLCISNGILHFKNVLNLSQFQLEIIVKLIILSLQVSIDSWLFLYKSNTAT